MGLRVHVPQVQASQAREGCEQAQAEVAKCGQVSKKQAGERCQLLQKAWSVSRVFYAETKDLQNSGP